MKLWLDDIRAAPDGWVQARSYDEGIVILDSAMRNNEKVVAISLDHDLGENSKSGYDLVLWLVERSLWPAAIGIHSSNPVGCKNMAAVIERYGPYGRLSFGRYSRGFLSI